VVQIKAFMGGTKLGGGSAILSLLHGGRATVGSKSTPE